MSAKPVILILGAGPRIGASVAKRFASVGYNVALASRKGTNSKTPEGYLSIQADFASASSIAPAFAAVRREFKASPSVVTYAAGATTAPPVEGDLLSVAPDSFVADNVVNIISPYVAAQEAAKGWDAMVEEGKDGGGSRKAFMYVGNCTNQTVLPFPALMTSGTGKSGAAYWIGAVDGAYAAKGYRFYYVDERFEDGKPVYGKVGGDAHAEFFEQLAAADGKEGDVPWLATFVKGKGYQKF